MSFDTVTFIIKDKEYSLHKFALKQSPILKELAKSSKKETINYEPEIDHKCIDYVFRAMYGIFKKKAISIKYLASIYEFMTYLCLCTETIDNFIEKYKKDFNFNDLVQYGIDNKCVYGYYEMIYKYKFILDECNIDSVKDLPLDNSIKKLLIRRHIESVYSTSDFDVVYARIVTKNNEYGNAKWYYCCRDLRYKYEKYLNVQNVECEAIYKDHTFKGFTVNGKEIPIVGNTKLVSNCYIGINLRDTVLNHIASVILGEVKL